MHCSIETSDHTVYISPMGFVDKLVAELAERDISVLDRRERLILAAGAPQRLRWAQNTWLEAVFLPVKSISDAARCLKSMQRNWAVSS